MPEQKTLIIDTSTENCSVAYYAGDKLVSALDKTIGRGHAELVFPMLNSLPDGGRAHNILVSLGPGSFTGIRIGIAVARALGLAWGATVQGYPTLALIAYSAFCEQDHASTIMVAQHGGHGEVFAQAFKRSPFESVNALRSIKVDVAMEQIETEVIAGSAAEMIVEMRGFGVSLPVKARAEIAYRLPMNLKDLKLSPIYGRGADARIAL